MMIDAKLSLVTNLVKTLTKLKKNTIEDFLNNPKEIKRSIKVSFTDKKLRAYHKITNWNKGEIHPIFPYALMTHLQFSMVNDEVFPFSPYGMVHKKEEIECFTPLKKGDWSFESYLESITPVEKGYEIISVTKLLIDKELCWTSRTIAYKKTKSGPSRIRPNREKIDSSEQWLIPEGHGRRYGFISNNVDPIHMSKKSARLMGFKKGAIMHGMWTVARGVSSYSKLKYPFKISSKFIAPIYMPGEVIYFEAQNGFGVYSLDQKRVHLLSEVL